MKKLLLIIITVSIFAYTLPWLMVLFPHLSEHFSDSNAANNFTGFSTPVLYLLTSILLFLSLREQFKANEIQTKREFREKLISEINWLENFLQDSSEDHSSSFNIQSLFCQYINNVNLHGESVEYLRNQNDHLINNHSKLNFILSEFDRIFVKVHSVKDEKIKNECILKLHHIFELYFSGAMTINFTPSRTIKETGITFIEKIFEKMKYWRSTLRNEISIFIP